MSERRDFLFELGCEELPPKALRALSQALLDAVLAGVEKAMLGCERSAVYATPRRLAVSLTGLTARQPDATAERRGPALTAAFDSDGDPTAAARGFARSCGVNVDELETLQNEQGAWLVFREQRVGQTVAELMPGILAAAINALPIPKRMRWGDLDVEFVRPVHWLVMLFGDEVIPAELFGVRSGRETYGHRFHHPRAMHLAAPASYVPLLESEGHVMPDFDARREAIRAQVLEAAVEVDGVAVIDTALLDEVTAMVEWPVAVLGRFEAGFLEVPAEALISAMKGHQKYFHVTDDHGRLMPYFVTVSNIESTRPEVVREGNERVIRPRLADAAFFWDQDRRQRLEARWERLGQVVFQKRLGSLAQKSERIGHIARTISIALGGNHHWAERAGRLCKCDLLTDMVNEFPELQGIMGRYYARHDREPEEVAVALDEQYLPRFAGDRLPATITGQAVAIADKLDTMIGIFGIGQIPTGDKDPFALRRAALGVLRIIIEQRLDLDLTALLREAVAAYDRQGGVQLVDTVVDQVYDFMMERLRAYYHERQIRNDVFDAVLSQRPVRPLDFDARVQAVEHFRRLPEAESLATANKRISNILKKTAERIPEAVEAELLVEPAEQRLGDQLERLRREVRPLIEGADYRAVLTRLASLREPVDRYFDEVMVMVEDGRLRGNRLAQLSGLRQLFLQVADLSCLQNQGAP